MPHQIELKTLSQRLQDKLDQAVLPGRLFCTENELAEVLAELKDNELNEELISKLLFGESSAGKQWRDILARIRTLQAEHDQRLKALDYLDAIIAAFHHPGWGFIPHIKAAEAWRTQEHP